MPTTLSRRTFLVSTTGLALASMMPGVVRAAGTTRVRPDIASPEGATMLKLYAKAVQAMQDPAINYPPQPQSWLFQAYIHAVPTNIFDPANSGGVSQADMRKRVDLIYGNPAPGSAAARWKNAALHCWGTCQHASATFLPWHRWYLYYFERICRRMCGDANFCLPYWNYGANHDTSMQLPTAFRTRPGDSPNPLFFDDRGVGFATPALSGKQEYPMNDGGYMDYSTATVIPALAALQMFPSDDDKTISLDTKSSTYRNLGFTGRVECVPHDGVHDGVGGWMGNVPSAAADPIFYVHHCQIDRLYATWTKNRPEPDYNWGSTPTDPSRQTWENQLSYFVDENGTLTPVTNHGAISTTTLGYTYDTLTVAEAPLLAGTAPATPELAKIAPRPRATTAGTNLRIQAGGTRIEVPLAAQSNALRSTSPGGSNSYTLILRHIKLLRRPHAPLRVFVNLPEGTAPELNSAYYAGAINLFNFDLATGALLQHDHGHADHAGHTMGPTFPGARFDITEVLEGQLRQGLWQGGTITVSITTVGADHPDGTTYLEIGSIEITPE